MLSMESLILQLSHLLPWMWKPTAKVCYSILLLIYLPHIKYLIVPYLVIRFILQLHVHVHIWEPILEDVFLSRVYSFISCMLFHFLDLFSTFKNHKMCFHSIYCYFNLFSCYCAKCMSNSRIKIFACCAK